MTDNTKLWDTLGKTDPAHTKAFKRSGGFSGTALKPMWVWKRLTEQFGPFGEGWGCDQPTFQVVPTATEILVYCTVSAWHGGRANVLWGVGGDKVLTVNKYGPVSDDEAFKKAFTDALMNAFKFVGVGADIHMGMFDDNKYVNEVRAEFAGEPEKRRDTGPGPVDGKDFYGCTGPGLSAHAAKKEGMGDVLDRFRQDIAALPTTAALREWIETNRADISPMPRSWRAILRDEVDERAAELGFTPNQKAA